MILYSARIENYKGIRGPLEVTFDAESPNLIEGPNGIGKSTLVEAIQQCLVESHTTTGAGAEEMRPRETALVPTLAVVFEHAGIIYRISKTFLDSPKSLFERKRTDGTFEAIAKGKAADEQVRGMLHSQSIRAKGRPGDRLGLFSVLCCTQGSSPLPSLSGDALSDIREMLGAQIAGAKGGAFERKLNTRYSSAWTPGGKPKKGKLAEVQTEFAAARLDLERCNTAMEQVNNLEAAARDQRLECQKTTAELAKAQAEYAPLAAVAQQVLDLRARRSPAADRMEAAQARWEQKRAEMQRVIDAGKRLRVCEEARRPLEEADVNAARGRDALVEDAIAAKKSWEMSSEPPAELAALEARIDCGAALSQVVRDLGAVRGRLDRAARAGERRSALAGEIAGLNAPDGATWTAIQAAGRESDEAQAHVEALVLRLEFVAECELTAEIVCGDPAGAARLAAGDRMIARGDGRVMVRLPGVGTIEVSGPNGGAADWRAKLADARKRLERLLVPFGVANRREMAARVEQRAARSVEVHAAEAEHRSALENDTFADIQEREQQLAGEHAAILAAEPSFAHAAPDLAAMRNQASDLKHAWQQRQAGARSAWLAAEELRADAERTAVTASALRTANDDALSAARVELAILEADGQTMAERQRELNTRRRECDSAEEVLREIDTALAKLPADAPERAAAVAQRIEALDSEIRSAREGYQQNEIAARTLLQQGPYTSLAAAEESVRQLEAEEAAESLRLDAIRRFKEAVDAAKEKALAGIAEPVESRATEILQRIAAKPLARIQLGESMDLESVRPDGCTIDAGVDQMSAGEQEQIYFATRLALAEVLTEQGRQTLVLDDPLVNTDHERMKRVLELIREKSARFQFIILTCHPERFHELPGIVTRRLNEARPEAVAA